MRLHFVGFGGGFGGHLGDEGDDGIDLGIDAVDLFEVLGERFASGEFFCANELGHLDCAGETERGGCGLSVKRCNGEERCGRNSHQDFAASWLVCDHVGNFIIGWRRTGCLLRFCDWTSAPGTGV